MVEECTLLRNTVRSRGRWVASSHDLQNNKSPKLNPTVSALFPQQPLALSLGEGDGNNPMLNWKTAGPDSLPVEFLKLDHPELTLVSLYYVTSCGKRENFPSNGKM